MKLKSTAGLLVDELQELRSSIEPFISEHFSVEPLNKPGSSVYVISPLGDKVYAKLNNKGQAERHSLLQRFNRLSKLTIAIFQDSARPNKKTIFAALASIRALIARDRSTWHSTADNAISDLNEHINRICSVLQAVFPQDLSQALLLADTNALYSLPDFQSWKFEGIASFTICLTPTVMHDLDEHKIYHKNPAVSEKARSIIGRIKELRRRGVLTEGVDVVKGSIRIMALATEPKPESTLSWLDPAIQDDRLIASAIGLMQKNAGRPIAVVTGDINLQNKCDFAGLPYLDIP